MPSPYLQQPLDRSYADTLSAALRDLRAERCRLRIAAAHSDAAAAELADIERRIASHESELARIAEGPLSERTVQKIDCVLIPAAVVAVCVFLAIGIWW
jgi:hypothetical protein